MMLFATTEPTLEPERPRRLSLADAPRHFRTGLRRRHAENLGLVLALGGRRTCAVPAAVFMNREGTIKCSTRLVRFRSLSLLPENIREILGLTAS